MPNDSGKLPIETPTPDAAAYETGHEAADDAFVCSQIEQRLHRLFRLAGDGLPAQQLLQIVIDYRQGRQS